MPSRLAHIAVCLAAAAAIVTGTAAAAPAHLARAVPKLIVGSYSGIKPRVIGFSGDGGNISHQDQVEALDPDNRSGPRHERPAGLRSQLRTGSETPVRATLILSRPRKGHFTKIVEVPADHTEDGYYGRSWPEAAQQR